jgi:hypothetical protein
MCQGRGECISQCVCVCYEDEEFDIPSVVCSCGHRNHDKIIGGDSECYIFCKTECPYNCQLVECHNFKLCGKKLPQQDLDCYKGMCSDCRINIGKIQFLGEKDDCPICIEHKELVKICCGKHSVCLTCWKEWSETSGQSPLTCPLCREGIWK